MLLYMIRVIYFIRVSILTLRSLLYSLCVIIEVKSRKK